MDGASYHRRREACLRRVGLTIDGRYKLQALLGLGATSAVYRAHNTWAGRACAVKLFQFEGYDPSAALRRFVREAQAINRVQKHGRLHPNVVDAIDVGRDRDTECFFIVQELLRGETLAEFLYRQPGRRVELPVAVDLLRPVIDAMATAHAAGVVHRDLKPDNIFLLEGGPGASLVPKVLDFGIAQVADARITQTREILGTPEYMPPEAFAGAAQVDARGDVWALGVILYEMLSGASPFAVASGSHLETMKRIESFVPPSLASTELILPATWNVLRRCMARDPEERYPDAGALEAALEGSLVPVQILRVPAGIRARALRAALAHPDDAITRAIRPRAEGSLGDARPPGEGPPTWWSLVFHKSEHTAAEVLEILALPELARLVELHVLETVLGDAGVQALARSRALKDLTRLTLRGLGLGPDGARALAASPHVANLTKLDLEDNPLGAEGLRALCASPSLENLKVLSLVMAGIDDAGVITLAGSGLLRRLVRLDLSRNHVSEAGLRALAASPHLDAQLTLIVSRNAVSRGRADAVVAALRERVRKLVI